LLKNTKSETPYSHLKRPPHSEKPLKINDIWNRVHIRRAAAHGKRNA